MKLVASDMFRVLGVETRVRIIELLKSKGPLGVKSLSGTLGITPAAVSQHLKILKQAGFVQCERRGYWIPYLIDKEALENCCGMMVKVCSCEPEETGKFDRRQLNKADLASLLEHKKKIESELQQVQKRIEELKARKLR